MAVSGADYGSVQPAGIVPQPSHRRKALLGLTALSVFAVVAGVVAVSFMHSEPEVDETELEMNYGLIDHNDDALQRLETEFPCTKKGKYYGTAIQFVYKPFGYDPCSKGGRYLHAFTPSKKKRVPFFLASHRKKQAMDLRHGVGDNRRTRQKRRAHKWDVQASAALNGATVGLAKLTVGVDASTVAGRLAGFQYTTHLTV
eukprot:CAMPEP_0117041996 /NCGR_PEP_ID=MMETSP0472-20121206/29277_1 /TAXON_ID=693140 ORGANISM="Tiarina fusus, Strain LIS" /NCGR_SAMPLE_ID=MMETSP0472 /ASSEMBLY_ACC=CAM_ASM_000603 /LENGTH=199 /DNA_ID=CAMNT_0004753125 /DNA_START=8 /DNA_END=605 /DNA_ORIENTATION=+